MNKPVDTSKSPRRTLRFEQIDEVIAEVDRLVAAEKSGRLKSTGNWTAGQVFAHLAAWIEYGYTGYPLKPPPWIIRVILRMRLKQFLRKGMPSGVRIPGVERGTIGQEEMSTPDAAQRLKAALERLRREPSTYDSPAFGKLSREDRIALNLRHAELHLGFLDDR